MNEATLLRAYGLDLDELTTRAIQPPERETPAGDLLPVERATSARDGEYGREPSMGSPTPEGMADARREVGGGSADSHPGSRSEAVGVEA